MKPLGVAIEIDGIKHILTIYEHNGIFQIIHNGRLLAALRPPGEDWQLMPMEEVIDESVLFENDLTNSKDIQLHSPQINEIIGYIESHMSD